METHYANYNRLGQFLNKCNKRPNLPLGQRIKFLKQDSRIEFAKKGCATVGTFVLDLLYRELESKDSHKF